MRNKTIPTILITLLLSACYPLLKSDVTKYISPLPKTSKMLDVPTYPSGHPFTYWHFSKQKEKQLGLRSLEKDLQDSLTFRIWITNPVGRTNQPHGLLEIKFDSSQWIGKLILMRVDLNAYELSETITSEKSWKLTPKTNWNRIIDSLYKLRIDSLPTDEKIPNYYTEQTRYSNNATTYSFEYSTKNKYRFYQYSNIYRAPSKFWQPRNVIYILDILDDEFKWDSIGRKYFRK